MNKTKKVSRADIARLAGVSGAAVTYALSDKESSKLKKETRDKILKIAEDLGYQPAFSGKSLSTGKSYTIGLLLPEQRMLNYLHYMSIVSGIAEGCEKTDYNLTLFFRNSIDKCMTSMRNGRIDGIIVLQSDFDSATIAGITNAGLPSVIVDYDYDLANAPANIACVRADHEKLIHDAFKFFISKKCKSIMHICAKQDRCASASSIMTNAFTIECQKHASSGIFGITLNPTLNFSLQIRNMLESGQRWDAFLVDSECLAELLIEELSKASLKTEKDCQTIVSSTGLRRYVCNKYRGELQFKNYYVQQQNEIGKSAWDVLSDMLAGKETEHKRLIPYKYWQADKEPPPCYWNSAEK